MNDRELLEKAATAAGLPAFWDELSNSMRVTTDAGNWYLWRPLADNGDALWLAVKLRIEVEPWIHGDSACARAAVGEVLIDERHYGDDPERATRRAIVRAAAAMGEK